MKQTLLKTAADQIVNYYPSDLIEIKKNAKYFDPCSFAVLFSDFMYGVMENEQIMQALYDKYESSPDDLAMEIYCDAKACQQFIQSIGDLSDEASSFYNGHSVTVQEIHYDGKEDPEAVYVITITGAWDVSVEKFANRVPNPSAEFIVWSEADSRRYFIDADYIGVFNDLL